VHKTCAAEILLVLRARKAAAAAYLVQIPWFWLHTEDHSQKNVN
jgi:hypothetical protein